MVRWIAVAVLLLAAGGTGWLAARSSPTRGLTLAMYDNLRWSGEPEHERPIHHLDHSRGPRRDGLGLDPGTSVLLFGWIVAPRGGEYQFSIASTDDVWLTIDSVTVVAHRRTAKESLGAIRLEKGAHHLRIKVRHRRGDVALKVRWRLPSGYMNLEAIPPVFLYPEDPTDQVTTPVAMRVTPVLLFLLAFFLALSDRIASFLRRLGSDPAFLRLAATGALLFVATVGFRAWDLNGAGETSDEWAYASAGRIYVANALHGDFDSQYWHANEEHPPIGKYLYGLISHLAGTDSYGPLRFASAVCAGLCVVLTFVFGVRFLSPWVGFLGGLILVLLPPFVAHGKVAALDSPSCLLFTLGVYVFVEALLAQRYRNRLMLLAGLIACIAFATKFSNATLFVFMAVAHFCSQWKRIRATGSLELPVALYVLPALPLLVLFLVWPWLWREPFGQLVTTLQHWDYPIQEWFLGMYRQPPAYYFPLTFLVTTPALLLVPFIVFFGVLGRGRQLHHVLLIAWFLTPFLWTLSVLKQDGIRYIYVMYPPLALMMGVGLNALFDRVPSRPAVATCTAVYLVWQCLLVHPYYLDYYSEAVGGVSNVYEESLFEVGWWGEGMDRAYGYVNSAADEGDTWDVIGVVNHTSDALRSDLEYSKERPDWLVKAYLTPDEIEREGYREVYRVAVADAPLAIVYERDDRLDAE